ncbi:MAG: C40 family peptidase [Treponema sp.]|jgi:probable lipoprotein NlpC|nr:C40 family peptidase [Treponema sp.]
MKRHSPSGPQAVFFLRAFLLLLLPGPAGLFAAAPLQSGYALAPRDSASPDQKAEAAWEARGRVIYAAEKYKDIPYRYGGMDRNGLDCSGLVYVSFRDALMVSVPRTTTGLYAWVEKIPAEQIQPGDLLFFKTDNGGKISHVGIYTGGGRFIHAASEGPVTGVIYSALDERYWRRTYAGAGRALPEGRAEPGPALAGGTSGRESAGETGRPLPGNVPSSGPSPGGETAAGKEPPAGGGRLLLGFAAAPSWNGFLADGNIIRGAAAQFFLGAETHSLKRPMLFGLELRPEWDGALGVFRMPITLSWGLNDKFRLFIGPSVSAGKAKLKTSDGDRYYTGGTSWIGAAGITAAPFSMKVPGGDLAVYGEFAWQSYFSEAGTERNWNADFAAGLRFSTGLRYTWRF